jgi:hypothetical protein
MTGFEKVTLTFSVAALVVSVVAVGIAQTWLEETFGSFRPVAVSGLPVLSTKDSVIMMSVPMHLTNRGAKGGCIADLAIRVKALTTKSEWNFFPVFYLEFRSYLANVKAPEKSIESPFIPVILGGRQSLPKSVLFAPRPAENVAATPLRVGDLKAGESYSLEAYILEGDDRCAVPERASMKSSTRSTFIFKEAQIVNLKKGIAVSPLDSLRDTIREQFVGGSHP